MAFTVDKKQILSVSEVNKMTRRVLEDMTLWVFGEIFDFKYADRKYYYIFFSLKDPLSGSILPCIMDPFYFENGEFVLENGKAVLAYGNLTLFEKTGKYQFSVSRMENYGESVIQKHLDELKNKLQKEGLFAQERKKQLPPFPTKVAVITSALGEAWQDFLQHSAGKFPVIELVLFDVYVQGTQAPLDIVKALKSAPSHHPDLVVITRGGGSAEDLAAFNTEEVARAIAACPMPVVSAVGHEKDVTIADLVADVRASTPTAAAHTICANYDEARQRLRVIGRSEYLTNDRALLMPFYQLADHHRYRLGLVQDKYKQLPLQLKFVRSQLDHQQTKLLSASSSQLQNQYYLLNKTSGSLLSGLRERLDHLRQKLNILSPQATLDRGYAIAYTQTGEIVKSVGQLSVGELAQLQFSRGRARAKIIKTTT